MGMLYELHIGCLSKENRRGEREEMEKAAEQRQSQEGRESCSINIVTP